MKIYNKFNIILDKRQKFKLCIILVLMIIGAFLETLGVSLIIPVMTSILNPEFFEKNAFAQIICNMFDLHSAKTFLIVTLMMMVFVFIFKKIFLYFEYYVQQRFICNNKVLMQKEIMAAILAKPYEYFLGTSTGAVQRTIMGDVDGTFFMLNNILLLFTEAIVTVVVFIAIFVINPIMAIIIVIALSIEMLVIAKILKPKMAKLGKNMREVSANTNKWIIQSVTGIKETKVADKADFFVDNYQFYATKGAKIARNFNVMNNAPRLIIESVTIAVLLTFISVILYYGKDVADIMPQLSAFAVAAVRLLPSANRISGAINAIPYNEPNLNALVETLQEIRCGSEDVVDVNNTGDKELSLKDKCELVNVTYMYPGSDVMVLDNADMVIPVGKSIGIVGPSGSGKTTTVDVILGLLNLGGGCVKADGVDIREGYNSWLKKISYIPQSIFMLDDTIKANVGFGYDIDDIDDDKVIKALEEAKLMDFVGSLPEGIETKIGERGTRLSGGQRQRIGIARALYNDPELLIFDEATSALDNETEAEIMESINSLHGKKTMIIIAHRLTTIEECDMVYRVEGGKISRER